MCPANIVFDPLKDAANLAKHGVSLGIAEWLSLGPYVTIRNDRFEYGEAREVAFGRIRGRLFACVFVDRGGERRVISLRKANDREMRKYGQVP